MPGEYYARRVLCESSQDESMQVMHLGFEVSVSPMRVMLVFESR